MTHLRSLPKSISLCDQITANLQGSDQTVSIIGFDVGVQTDCHSSSSLCDDGLFNVPDSFALIHLLIDYNGRVEEPSSIFSLSSEKLFGNLDDNSALSSVLAIPARTN